MDSERKVFVTGIGCLSSLGTTFPESINNLFQKRARCARPRRFDLDSAVVAPVFEIDDSRVKWKEHLSHRGRTAQLAVVASAEALENAELTKEALHFKRVGVCLGTTVGNSLNNEESYRLYLQGETPLTCLR